MAVTAFSLYNYSTSVSINLLDPTKFNLKDDGWAPAIAELRAGELGGYGPYDDVEEVLTLDVVGATPGAVMANIGDLKRIVDQAERWSRGESVGPITMGISITGGISRSAVVVGGSVVLPENFADRLFLNEQESITLRIVRHGWLFGLSDVAYGTAAAAQPSIHVLDFVNNHPPISPVDYIAVTGFASNTADISFSAVQSWLLWAPAASYIQISEAETNAAGGGFATVADTNASNGNYLRMNSTSSVITYGNNITITQKRMSVFAMIRNPITTDCRIRGRAYANGRQVTTRWETILGGSTIPLLVPFGEMETRDQFNRFEWEYVSASGSAQLEMDYFILLGIVDDYTCGAVQVNHSLLYDSLSGIGPLTYRVSPRMVPGNNPRQSPEVIIYGAGATVYAGYRGAPVPCVKGSSMAVVFIASGGGNGSTANWRFTNTSGTVVNVALSSSRARAYLIVE